MPYPMIDATKLKVLPLSQRKSYLDIRAEAIDPALPAPPLQGSGGAQVGIVAAQMKRAREAGASRMIAYGAHLIKNGAGPLLVWLIENGWLTHLATQGAGVIHDWEFAFQGLSSESVADNAPVGRFGSWDETGRWINLAVLVGAAEGLGFGESVGRLISSEQLTFPSAAELVEQIRREPAHPLSAARADLLRVMEQFKLPSGVVKVPHPHKRYSVLAAAYEHRVPMTIHPGIGYDIIVNHPMYHGGAVGRASGTDTRIYAQSVKQIEGGVYMSVGSAIMSPQIFEKAFSAANNLFQQEGKPFLRDYLIALVDLQSGGGWDWKQGEPPKTSPAYYLRYCKTFYRMGGTLEYIQADNRAFLQNLIHALRA